MSTTPRGSTLVIAIVVVLVAAVIAVGILRFSTREVAGAAAAQRQQALVTCAEAARQLLQSRFKMLGTRPTEIAPLDQKLDGDLGRLRAMGGHFDADPNSTLVTVKQVEAMPAQSLAEEEYNADVTNKLGAPGGGGGQNLGGTPLKVTVHCQEGDLSSPTSGRQLEIEFGIKFGL